MARNSWRYLYSDQNKSIVLKEAETQFNAFWAIRGRKGDVEAKYIAPDNADLIKMMFGNPSADYPDIYNLIEFNKKYGVLVSAAPGTSKEIPNFYGGVYNTTKGLLQMYGNTSKDTPNFQVSIKPAILDNIAKEKDSNGVEYEAYNYVSEISSKLHEDIKEGIQFNISGLNKRDEQAIITITGIPADVVKHMDNLVFDYWNNKSVTGYKYVMEKLNDTMGVFLPAADMTDNADARLIACGYYEYNSENGTYTFVLGGTNSIGDQGHAWNKYEDEVAYGIPFIDFTRYNNNEKFNYENYGIDPANPGEKIKEAKEIEKAILTGGKAYPTDMDELNYKEKNSGDAKPLAEKFRILYNVKDITMSFANQPSPTAEKTTIAFTNFVYDKYLFDKMMDFTDNEEVVKSYKKDGEYADIVFIDGALVSVKKFDEESGEVVDVTEDYETMKIALNAYVGTYKDGDDVVEVKPIIAAKDYVHNIYIVEDGSLCIMKEDDPVRPLQVNPMFNSFTLEGTETDENGEVHSTTPISGSLDPKAETENGMDFFFEDVFVPDQASYISHRVINVMDEFLDEKGFYTGYRIEGDAGILTVNGQRFLDYVIKEAKDLHADDRFGCYGQIADSTPAIQKKFATCAKQSLVEAQKGKYEDCFLFVDCYELDSVKEYYSQIRTNHPMGDIISVKLLNQQLFEKVSKTTVAGRVRGGIQICQEFKFKDENKNYYYGSVIGPYAAMVMKTIEEYRGGKQPCWINEKDIGGQLDIFLLRTPISARWDLSDTPDTKTGAKADTEILDLKGVNPIALDPTDGVIVLSGVTTELNAGDWSRVNHTVAFDCCKRELRDNVMKPQIEKPIDDHYIEKRQEDAQKIVSDRVNKYKIWSYGKADCKDCNTELTKAQEIFNLDVEVRVKPNSRKVRLTFTNLGQITIVKD